MKVKLGNYKGFDIPKPQIVVSDEEISDAILKLQNKYMVFEDRERPAKAGDYIVISYECYFEGDYVKELSVKKHNFKLGMELLNKKFEEALIGKSKGDTFDLEVTFDNSFDVKYLRNETALFKVIIHSITEKVLPELCDDVVLSFKIEGIHTVEKLKRHLNESIYVDKKRFASVDVINEIMKRIIDCSSVELSDDEIDKLKFEIFEDFKGVLKRNNASLELYTMETGTSEDSLMDMCRQEAIVYLTEKSIIEKIAEIEGIRLNVAETLGLSDEDKQSAAYEKVVGYLLSVNSK